MKCTPTFKLKYKSKFLKAKIHSYFPTNLRQLERSLKWLGVASKGLVMALRRRAQIFQEEEESSLNILTPYNNVFT